MPSKQVPLQAVVVQARGRVRSADLAHARDRVARVTRGAPRAVLYVRIHLVVESAPPSERPVLAEAEIDASGQMVRAQATGTTTREAVDRLVGVLRARLAALATVQASRTRS